MSMELIAIISVGVALAGIILNGQRNQRAEFKDIRLEIKTLREETQIEIKALREETRIEIESLRDEMRAGFKALREEMNGLQERMAHLEGLLEGLREAISGRSVAVPEAVAEQQGKYEQP